MNELWGQRLMKDFFNQGGFDDRSVVSSFKDRFLRLLENSSLENRISCQDFDLLAMISLVFLEANATNDEIEVLLIFIGRVQENRSTKTPLWFSRLSMELIEIKHEYEWGSAWHCADGLDSVLIECVQESFNRRISLVDRCQFRRNLAARNKHRFSNPICLDSLHELKNFLLILSDDGSATASYFLLLLGFQNDETKEVIERLKRLSEQETRVCQLATLHLGLAFSQDNATNVDAQKALREARYDFKERDPSVLPELYQGIRTEALKALDKLLGADDTANAASEVNIIDLVDEQHYRIKCCIEECIHAARGMEWKILLPIWVTSLAVEGGKLVELLWMVSLISSIRRSQNQTVVAAALDSMKTMSRKSEKDFVIWYHGEAGHESACEQSCGALMLSLFDFWRPKKGIEVMEFLYASNGLNGLDEIKALFDGPEGALHVKTDYATLLLANILLVPFDPGHPLGRLWLDENQRLEKGLKDFRKTFDLRNDNAHYRVYECTRGMDKNFENVLQSVKESVEFSEVLKKYF